MPTSSSLSKCRRAADHLTLCLGNVWLADLEDKTTMQRVKTRIFEKERKVILIRSYLRLKAQRNSRLFLWAIPDNTSSIKCLWIVKYRDVFAIGTGHNQPSCKVRSINVWRRFPENCYCTGNRLAAVAINMIH